ncbi:zinc finger protein weckle-like [Limulus polyphemus]|uniref:Zinc finger protein weckle-like n=1 Tax=Limulus polyphemus TaxID=6850 RepID=A0ABM1C2S6_LIMPO|nr:zinc finger protein weckle-like [Limulus polyphemus]
MEEGVHLSPGNTEINDTLHSPGKSPGSGTAESTCFVCCMRFSTVDMCHEHQKHVHMRWVDRQLPDHSHEELSVPNDFTEKNTNSSKSSPQLTANPEEKVPTDKESGTPVSSEVEGEDNHGGDETSLLGDSETTVNKIDEKLAVDTAEDVECNFDKCDSQVISENSTDVLKTQQNGLEETTSLEATEESFTQDTLRTNLIVMNDVPSDKQLAELGFPSKVGHYCHLCDTVIQSYPLYYMHMYNVHSLEKRFQCIISDCKHTFSNATAFQCHAQKHNQKSESFCSLCDMVFEDTKSLQDHIFSPQHGEKYIKTQEKYFHSEPRNYRCKVCLTWFGLFAIYVKHMETESHQYRCKYCGLSFVQPGPRRNHIQSVHPEVANVCEV